MKTYKILQKPNGVIDRVTASSPKDAIEKFLEKNPEWVTPENLRAKKELVKRIG